MKPTKTTKAEIDAALESVRTTTGAVTPREAAKAALLLVQGKVAQAKALSDADAAILAAHDAYMHKNLVTEGSGNTPADVTAVEAWRQNAIAKHAAAYEADKQKAFATVDAIIGVVVAAGMTYATGGASAPAILGALAPLAAAFMDYGNGNDNAFDNLAPFVPPAVSGTPPSTGSSPA